MEAILILHQEGGSVRSVDLAGYMGYSKASVSHAVKSLRMSGFLMIDEGGFLHLSHVGQEIAEGIYEKHCFFRQWLIDAGADPKTAEQDACKLEHSISQQSFECVRNMYKR